MLRRKVKVKMQRTNKYDKYWNKAVSDYQKKYLGLALVFCSGEKILNKAMEYAKADLKEKPHHE